MIEVLANTDQMRLRVEEMGGFHFLHLDVYEWNKSVLQDCRTVMLDTLRNYRDSKQVGMFFAIAKDAQTLRFYRMVRPYDYEQFATDEEGRSATVVAWDTEE